MMKTRILLFAICALLCSLPALAQLRQVAVIELPGEPGFDGVAYIDGSVVIAHSGNNTLDVFDTATRRLVKQVEGMSNPRGIVVNPDAGLVYVANAGSKSIAEVSSKDWSVHRTLKIDQTPDQLLLVGSRLYSANSVDGSVSVIDLPLGRAVMNIDVHGTPQSVVYDRATRQVFVSLEDVHQVIAISPDGQVTRRYTLTASQPTGMAIDTANRRLYVAVRYAVVVLNADNGSEVGRVAAPAGANGVSFDPATGTAFVAASDGTAAAIRCAGGHCSYDELSNDIRGHSVALDPNRNFLYMPGAWRGRSKLVILKPVTNPPGLVDRGTANAQAQPAPAPPPQPFSPPHPAAAELLGTPHQ